MRGIRCIPLMPPIPLHIGIPEDSHPQNEGDRPKTLFFIFFRQANFLTTKYHFTGNKVPPYRHQSISLPASKYTFVIDEVPSRRPRGYSSRPTRIVLNGLESSPRHVSGGLPPDTEVRGYHSFSNLLAVLIIITTFATQIEEISTHIYETYSSSVVF